MGCGSSSMLGEPIVLDGEDYLSYIRYLHNQTIMDNTDQLRLRSMIRLMSPHQVRQRLKVVNKISYPTFIDVVERRLLLEQQMTEML